MFNGHTGHVRDLSFHAFNDHVIASAAEDTEGHDLANPRRELQRILLHARTCVSFGAPVSCSRHSPHLVLTSPANSRPLAPRLSGHARKVGQVRFHRVAENVLLSAPADLTFKVWDVEKGEHRLFIDGFRQIVEDVCGSYNGVPVAATSREKVLRIFDPRQQAIAHVTPPLSKPFLFKPQTCGGGGVENICTDFVKGSRVVSFGKEVMLPTTTSATPAIWHGDLGAASWKEESQLFPTRFRAHFYPYDSITHACRITRPSPGEFRRGAGGRSRRGSQCGYGGRPIWKHHDEVAFPYFFPIKAGIGGLVSRAITSPVAPSEEPRSQPAKVRRDGLCR